jgi:hypothetical protein
VKKHLSSSFIVESMLQTAILIRKSVAFANVYRLVLIPAILDFVLFVLAVILAENLYGPSYWLGFPDYVKPWIYIVPAFIQIIISFLSQTYKKESISVLRIIVSLIVGFVLISSITYFFKQYAFSRAVILITYGLLFFGLSFWRIFVKLSFGWGLSTNPRKRKTIIVGTGSQALELESKLKESFTNIYQVVGYISSSIDKIGKKINNLEVVGSLENINKVLIDNKIDKVIFSSDEISFNKMITTISSCRKNDVEFLFSGNELDYLIGKSSITALDNMPLVRVKYNISLKTHKIAKAIFDMVISVPIIIFIYPLVFLYSKIFGKKSDLINFIFETPTVLFAGKSFIGPLVVDENSELYLGKSGLTGLWYTETIDNSEDEIKKLNIFYAKNQNIWLDLEILGKTIAKMIIKMEK